MPRNFKLSGTTEAKFKKLEIILPRIMSHMSTKTYGIIPASVINSYKELVNPGEFIFNSLMFAGKIKKVLFKVQYIDGKAKPVYSVALNTQSGQQMFTVETKKLSHFVELNVDVADGDVLTVAQLADDVVLHFVNLVALVEIKQDYNTMKEFVTEQLLETIEDEGI